MKLKSKIFFTSIISIILLTARSNAWSAGLGDVLDQAKGTISTPQKSTGSLSNSDMADGLKEALSIGAGNAVGSLSKTDGFFKNPGVKILLPKPIKKVEPLLKSAGFGKQVDDFELSMNRAAERAAPEAKNIFIEAIKEMSFQDSEKILRGRENEATLYFKDKSSARLRELFKPITHDAMAEVGVTKKFQDLSRQVETIPMAGSVNMDLDSYVTEKSLDGLFFMIAAEEKKIRQNPAARVTDILKKVFK